MKPPDGPAGGREGPDWFRIANETEVPTPAVLIYPDRVAENLRRMAKLAGGVHRLRPHVKTHKLPQIVALALAQGVAKFKTATIAEAEMCARAGAPDIMLAYQPVGPHVRRLAELAAMYPGSRVSCLADDPAVLQRLSAAASERGVMLGVWIDLNVGMDRTGVAPGPEAVALYTLLAGLPSLRPEGLHAYDGHLHDTDHSRLVRAVGETYRPVWALRDALLSRGLPVPRIAAAGTASFPLLANGGEAEVGAGATLLWDDGKAARCPDLDFLNAAVVLTRVVSRPTGNRVCLDLGHKAVASEMPHPRVRFLGLPAPTFLLHSEEHLVISTPLADTLPVGTVLYGIPAHVCTTVALQGEVAVVRGGRMVEFWAVTARDRRLTV